MIIKETNLKGCFILEPTIFEDKRGIFFESFNKKNFEQYIGKSIDFIQDNHSTSRKGVLRGLHYQKGGDAQAKLVRVVKGEVLDVVVDLRKESDTFGEHFKTKLTEHNYRSLFIPKGMAHGFLALKNKTIFVYKCDNYYERVSESGIIYNDVDLGVDWEYPLEKIILSEKDKRLPTFKDLYL